MIATNHRIHDFAPAEPAQKVPVSGKGRASDWVRRAADLIKENPLVILVGVFDALFYGSVIALLAYL